MKHIFCKNPTSRTGFLIGTSLSLHALISTGALAEAAAIDAATDIEEISITATRGASDVFTFPGSVSVISKDEIETRISASIAEIFASTPGVQFDGGPRRTGETPALRGISGEGVLVLFDGVRQNFLSGHDGQFFIEPDLLRSAEVVRGPGSALYGSSALGGVIAFETVDAADLLEPDSQFGYRVKGGFQGVSNEWMAGGTLFGRSQDGAYSGIASLTYRDSGNINLARGENLQGDDQIASGLIKASAQLTDAFKLDMAWIKFSNQALEPNNGQGLSTGDLVQKDIDSETWRARATYNPENDLIDLGLVAYVNTARVDEDEIDTTRSISRRVKTHGVVLDNRSKLALSDNASVTFTYGGEYYHDEQVGSDNTTTDGTRGGVPSSVAETFGAFAQADILVPTAIGSFRIIPAIRYDSFKNTLDENPDLNTKDGATSPKIGLSYAPKKWLLLFANYSEAFRAPSYNEIFADNLHFTIPLGPGVEAPNFFVPNLDLKPETAKAFEFGAGLTFEDLAENGDQLVIKGSYYNNDVSNLIDLEVNVEFSTACFVPGFPGVCTSGTSRNINTNRAELSGFEVEGQYNSDRFYFSAAYSTIDGTDKNTGDYVGILSPNRLNLVGEVKLPAQDMRVGLRSEFAGKFTKVNDPVNERDAYKTVDTYLVWQPDSGGLKGLRVDLGINNIFNTNAERVFADVPSSNRNFRTTISWTSSF